jgi:hypothetical protein
MLPELRQIDTFSSMCKWLDPSPPNLTAKVISCLEEYAGRVSAETTDVVQHWVDEFFMGNLIWCKRAKD